MASPAVIDPRANYALVLSQSPPESGRVSSTITSTSGSTFSSITGQNTIEFLIPPVSHLDCSGSYLQYSIALSATQTNAAVVDYAIALDNVPAMAPFATARLYNSENVLITEMTDLQALALHKVESMGVEYATFASQAMGYTSAWNATTVRADGVAETTPVVDDIRANPSKYPGRISATQADAAGVKTGSVVTFAIPLAYFSGVFGKSAYLPLKYSGSRANAFRLEITTAPANVACVALGKGNITTNLLAGSVSYNITDIKMVVQYTNLGPETDAMIAAGVNSSTGLQYLYDDWTSRTDSGWNNSGTYNTLHPKYSISLKSVVVQLRDRAATTSLFQPSISGCRRYGLKQYQSKVGPQFYPNAPVQFNTGTDFNGHAFIEWALASGSLLSNTHQAYNDTWNKADSAGWEFALDFDRKQRDSEDVKTTFSGKDTRSGSSQVELLMERANSSTNPLVITVLFNTDNVLIINKGNTYALERS